MSLPGESPLAEDRVPGIRRRGTTAQDESTPMPDRLNAMGSVRERTDRQAAGGLSGARVPWRLAFVAQGPEPPGKAVVTDTWGSALA